MEQPAHAGTDSDNTPTGMTRLPSTPIINQDLRRRIVDLVTHGKGGHIPSAFSIVDIIATLYGQVLRFNPEQPRDENRDYFILSKGHGCAALYAVLHRHGFLSGAQMENYLGFDGILGGHPDRTKVPGAEASTGSLGHGLPFSLGIALGLKVRQRGNKVVTLVGDGECHEGTVWESALVAQNLGLGNLCCIVDYNGSAAQILPHPDIAAQWRAFGWQVCEVDGHDPAAIADAVKPFMAAGSDGAPTAIVAHTVKGRGVSFMESHGPWHHRIPNPEEYAAIMKELE